MKKLLKIFGIGFGVFLAAVAIAAATIFVRSNSALRKTHVVKVQPVAASTGADALARGKHLATTRGCLDCHGPDFGGARVFENGAMGKVHGPNLTKGSGGLPADFGDADFVRAVRHGVGRDGRGLFLMPSTDYTTISDDDMGALLAYWKSAAPVNRPRGPVELGPIARMLLVTGKIKIAADEIDHANVKPAVVTPGVTVEYGKYLAATCTGCHGANLSGGKIEAGPPDWPPAANLTPHADGRVAKWTEDDFIKAIRTAKRPDGSEISPVMPRAFANFDDVEVRAIWKYIKALPAAATGVR